MQETRPALPMRDHTILGVCDALGEDFGFNPLYLRIVFAASLIWEPVYVVAAYLALGLVVLVSRLLVPNRRTAPATDHAPAAAAAHAEAEDREELAVAA